MLINRYENVKKDTFPYFIVLGAVCFFNIIFTAHFINIFLAGIVFMLFMETVRKKYYYVLLGCFAAFCFIESIHGLSIFSLSLTAVLVYTLIIPQVKHIFSSKVFSKFLYLFIFYLSFFIYTYLISAQVENIHLIFLLNLVLDAAIIGLFL